MAIQQDVTDKPLDETRDKSLGSSGDVTGTTVRDKHPIPRKLNPGMIEALSIAIAKGNYYVTACALCDIDESTLYDWLNLAKSDVDAKRESMYSSLAKSLKKAEAEAEARRVARIEEAGEGGALSKRKTTTYKDGTEVVEETYGLPQWLADMTHLERRHPDRWGRKDRTRVDITETKKVIITHVDIVLSGSTSDLNNEIVEGEVVDATERTS